MYGIGWARRLHSIEHLTVRGGEPRAYDPSTLPAREFLGGGANTESFLCTLQVQQRQLQVRLEERSVIACNHLVPRHYPDECR